MIRVLFINGKLLEISSSSHFPASSRPDAAHTILQSYAYTPDHQESQGTDCKESI